MRLQTRLYVTTQGCSEASAARERMYAVATQLDERHGRSVISGYQMFVLESDDDYDEHDLDRSLIEHEIHGRFPAIFLNVTYRIDRTPPDESEVEPIIAEHAFRHLLTESDAP